MIVETISREGQTTTLQRIAWVQGRNGPRKVRYTVRAGVQSYARVELFSETVGAWHEMHTIPGDLVQAPLTRAPLISEDFNADLAELERVASAMLNGVGR